MRKLVYALFLCGLIAAFHLCSSENFTQNTEDDVPEDVKKMTQLKTGNEAANGETPKVFVLNGLLPGWYTGLLTFVNGFTAPLSATKIHEYLVNPDKADFHFSIDINDTSMLKADVGKFCSISINLTDQNGKKTEVKIQWFVSQKGEDFLEPGLVVDGLPQQQLLTAAMSVSKFKVSISAEGVFTLTSVAEIQGLTPIPRSIPKPQLISVNNNLRSIEFELSADKSQLFFVHFDNSAVGTLDKTPADRVKTGQYIAIAVVIVIIIVVIVAGVGGYLWNRRRKKQKEEQKIDDGETKKSDATAPQTGVETNSLASAIVNVAAAQPDAKATEAATPANVVIQQQVNEAATPSNEPPKAKEAPKQDQKGKGQTTKDAAAKPVSKEKDSTTASKKGGSKKGKESSKASTEGGSKADKKDSESTTLSKEPSKNKDSSKGDTKSASKKESDTKQPSKVEPKAGSEKKVAATAPAKPPPSAKKP